ncbi:DNA-binding transcriptional regulator DsdC [Gammaproteobacteria bacterium ESL0073]|nr:DNA-binding transcriptional regulator DsdC [Gammaproteobacteria bacterium ESL0073]
MREASFLSSKQEQDSFYQQYLNQKTILNDQHLINLQTFIYAANSLSFQLAADQLCLSPSAVSHRINKLEKQLGFQLFHRFTRKIKLTTEGERLYGVLKNSFSKINSEIHDIRSCELSGSLNVFSHPSVAENWLLPRLADFVSRYPSIQINIRMGNEQASFQEQAIDLAIYYSNGYFPGFNSECLMEEQILPVCTKAYAEQNKLINQPESLGNCTLLHDAKAWHYSAVDAEWHVWCKQMKIDLPQHHAMITFDSSRSSACAAIYGMGVAIGRLHLVRKWLDTGMLISPFKFAPLRTSFNYYLVWPRLQYIPPRLEVFLAWIKQQGEMSQQADYQFPLLSAQ